MSFGLQLLVHLLEVQNVYQSTRQYIAVAVVLYADFLQHLMHNHLDVLIVDIHTLQTVYTLYLAEHVILNGADTFDLQNIMRVDASFCQLVAGLQHLAVLHLDTGTVRDQIGLGLSVSVVT